MKSTKSALETQLSFFTKLYDKRLELLFAVFILAIFFNIRKYFPISESFVLGRLVEYRIPAMFLTDIVFVGLLLLGILDRGFRKELTEVLTKRFKIVWFILYVYFLAQLLGDFTLLDAYAFVRIVYFLVLFASAKILVSRITLSSFFKKINERTFGLLFIAVTGITLLQLIPYLFYLLDIECFYCNLFGAHNILQEFYLLVKADVFGSVVVRNYGFFPHPNVLAGVLTTFFALNSYFFLENLKKEKRKLTFMLGAYFFYLITTLFVVLLTFSATGLFALLLVIVFILLYVSTSRKSSFMGISIVLSLLAILGGLFLIFAIFSKESSTFFLRWELIVASWEMIKANPLFGIGPLNFVAELAPFGVRDSSKLLFLQPVHNVYILIITEYGILFGGFFLLKFFQVVIKVFKTKSFLLILPIISIMIISFFDHYFWTLNQGILTLVLILALLWSEIEKSSNH